MWYFILYVLVGLGMAGYALYLNLKAPFTLYLSDVVRVIFVVCLWPIVVVAYIPWDKLSKFDRKIW
jgi:hypothetical protein